jgi:hypothetical protein
MNLIALSVKMTYIHKRMFIINRIEIIFVFKNVQLDF